MTKRDTTDPRPVPTRPSLPPRLWIPGLIILVGLVMYIFARGPANF